ncbi:DsbA family protein [Roseovarius nubinhibens]|uniref:DsbA family protein n=1 Tax=Roseovarius nubinhibens TaxID=314263 RepID=UPI0030B8DF2D
MNKTSAIGATALVIGLGAAFVGGTSGVAQAAEEVSSTTEATVGATAETSTESTVEAVTGAVVEAAESATETVTEAASEAAEAAGDAVESAVEAVTGAEAEATTEEAATEEAATEEATTEGATTEAEASAEASTEASTETEATATTEEAEADENGIVEMVLGNEDAKVTVMEYASFTCPHCASFHENQFKQLKADYIDTGKIRFVYRDVYFDRYGLWAAMVARCEGPSKFFGISDLLYEQQREWMDPQDPVKTSENLRRLGRIAGLDGDKLTACLEDEDKARALVSWWQENSEADDISSTPTLLINGESHGNMNYADLKELIEAELAE